MSLLRAGEWRDDCVNAHALEMPHCLGAVNRRSRVRGGVRKDGNAISGLGQRLTAPAGETLHEGEERPSEYHNIIDGDEGQQVDRADAVDQAEKNQCPGGQSVKTSAKRAFLGVHDRSIFSGEPRVSLSHVYRDDAVEHDPLTADVRCASQIAQIGACFVRRPMRRRGGSATAVATAEMSCQSPQVVRG